MDQIIPGLWLGDLPSALDVKALEQNRIQSILTAMKGTVNIQGMFLRHQADLTDVEEEDILVHFLPCITFIEGELGKGRGVLVHCQAGISRSATIVAAYLMKTRKMTSQEALDLIRESRPMIDPNAGFLCQLDVFYHAGYTSSPSATSVRRYYVDRTAIQIQEGGEANVAAHANRMLESLPPSPTVSSADTSANEASSQPRRWIRCKMCRRELATREFMLEHGAISIDPRLATTPSETEPPPIMNDPRCSGYFIEPMKWMGHFLKDGNLSGKIICPNERCQSKLGNYYWAGTRCGCNHWVGPGFCIGRSRVDEVTR